MFMMKYWTWSLVNDIRRMSEQLIMSEHKEKRREERQMLMYAVTLGEVVLFAGVIVKSDLLGWWMVPMKFLPSLLTVLETLQMTDQGGSWMRIMSKCD